MTSRQRWVPKLVWYKTQNITYGCRVQLPENEFIEFIRDKILYTGHRGFEKEKLIVCSFSHRHFASRV